MGVLKDYAIAVGVPPPANSPPWWFRVSRSATISAIALEPIVSLCQSRGMTGSEKIARLAVSLDEVKPPVRRRIEVPLGIRLDRLHRVLQIVMG
jgi:hypothetical protein